MASSDNELESQLMEAGSKLVDPPSSFDELLPLLDKIESCLQKVEQSPNESMQNALSPSQKALVSDQLLRHSNIDVKVVVASCISEITRITAPDAPYDDDQMKEVFQLIVSSFENIDDKLSRSYTKRISILETVAKVRSCVVMLDLECDSLILQMFQHFLRTIRDYHPENVFSSMEIIMTLVLEESEDISLEILSPILATVKKGNKDVLPIARKLGERVLESCAAKLKPCLVQAVETKSIALYDYSKVLASIYQDAVDNGQNEVQASCDHKADESNTVEASGGVGEQEIKEVASETSSPSGKVDRAVQESCKPDADNSLKQTGENEYLHDSNSLKEQDDDNPIENFKDLKSNNAEPDSMEDENASNKEKEPEQSTKRRGIKRKHSLDDSNCLKKQDVDHPIENSKELKSSKADLDILENDNASNKENKRDQSTKRRVKKRTDALDDSNSMKKQDDHPIENNKDLKSSKAEPDILENDNTPNKEKESEKSTKRREKKRKDPLDDSNSMKKQDVDHPIENNKDLKSSKAEPDILEKENTSNKEKELEQSTKRREKKRKDILDDSNSMKKQDVDHPIENNKDLKLSKAEPDILEHENTSNKEKESEQSTKRREKKRKDPLDDSNFPKKQDGDHPIENSEDLRSSTAEPNILENENLSNKEQESEQSTKRRGKQRFVKSISDDSHAENEIENEKLSDQKCHVEYGPTSHGEGPSNEVVVPSENNDESIIKQSPSEALENESTDVASASASPNRNNPDKISTKKAGRQKKKDNLDKDALQPAADASKKVADGISDSEVKANKRSGKKLPSLSSYEKKTSTVVDASVKENIVMSDSETKPSKQSSKKVGVSNKKNDGPTKHPVARKKEGREKDLTKEDTPKAAAKNNSKEMISSSKSATKSAKNENQLEMTPKTGSKRKRPLIKVDDPKDEGSGEEMVGSKIKVWWPADKQYYDGIVGSFDPVKRKHKVLYADGEEEELNLRRQRWEIIEPSEGGEDSGQLSPQDSDEMLLKKFKTNSGDAVSKGGKNDGSSKRSEGDSSSKPKGTANKSGHKSKEGGKVEGRSKDDSKSVSKSENETSGKSKDHTSRIGANKSGSVLKKTSSKSNNTDNQASKTISEYETSTPAKSKQTIGKIGKSNQDMPKTPSKSKGKSSQSVGKSNDNGTGKVKFGSSKIKQSEDVKNISDTGKVQESTKGKLSNSSKAKGSETKLGKKRKR